MGDTSFPECEECLASFNSDTCRPLLLPCGHVYCGRCLNTAEDSGNQVCFKCNHSWRDTDVAQLPTVYHMISALNKVDVGSACSGMEVCSGENNVATPTGREVGGAAGPSGREVASHPTGREIGRGTKNSKNKFPECDVCNDDFNNSDQKPLFLHCGHTFCQRCLEFLRQDKLNSCPMCRRDWSHEEVSKLPVVASLIHPSNANKTTPKLKRPSAASGTLNGRKMTREEVVGKARALQSTISVGNPSTKADITVTDITGRHKTVQLKGDDTISNLKKSIRPHFNVEPDHQQLIYRGKHLKDSNTISDCGMRGHSNDVRMAARQYGGM